MSPDFIAGFGFDHSEQLQSVFRRTFGLHKFRPNQLETINAAMLGHDCFVLMPTGKSSSFNKSTVWNDGFDIPSRKFMEFSS